MAIKYSKFFILLIVPFLLIPVYAQETTTEIPVWVKGVASFWVEGNINDDEFGEAVTFLIEQGIFKIDSVVIPEQEFLSDDKERLYKLEIANLEEEVKDVGLDNSHLLNSIVNFEDLLEQRDEELKNYRNTEESTIGQPKEPYQSHQNDQVDIEQYRELEREINDYEIINQSLEETIEQLEDAIEDRIRIHNDTIEAERERGEKLVEQDIIIDELRREIEDLKEEITNLE